MKPPIWYEPAKFMLRCGIIEMTNEDGTRYAFNQPLLDTGFFTFAVTEKNGKQTIYVISYHTTEDEKTYSYTESIYETDEYGNAYTSEPQCYDLPSIEA